ncbi:MAG TPA: hypothetical protein VGW74_05085 [Propionibacteriaceae bacterium]|nr:hypothetical protein [Propionibacteriaceae bacterium]
MGIYSARPGRLAGQIFGDLFVLGWAVVWGGIGIFVNQMIAVLAIPARETARTASKLMDNMRDAGDQAARVPGVGEDLRRPFDAASVTLTNLIASANDQVASIERLALIGGWVVFGIPVAIVVALWLPRRVRFYRQARASQAFLDSTADLDLFALRAMASQPLYVLAAVSDDPVKAWLAGDRQVIDALAAIELRRNGLRLPKNRLEVST